MGPIGSSWSIRKMAQVARGRLVVLAQQRLFTSSADYVRGIQPMRLERTAGGGERIVIDVLGALPWMVEHGMPAWDLRATILKPGTRRLKVSRAGYFYASIPFEHADPGASGRNAAPAGSQYTEANLRQDSRAFRGDLDQQAARTMGRAVMREARELAATRSAVGGGRVQYGGRLAPGTGGAQVLRDRHVTDLFAGMIRQEKTYERATQNTFTTFRTISNNPDSMREDQGGKNWTHPGITARRLIPEAKDYMERMIAQGAFNA